MGGISAQRKAARTGGNALHTQPWGTVSNGERYQNLVLKSNQIKNIRS